MGFGEKEQLEVLLKQQEAKTDEAAQELQSGLNAMEAFIKQLQLSKPH